MITLFWNPAGLQVSDFLTGESFDGYYFVRNGLTSIHLLPIVAAAHDQKRFILYMHNSMTHRSKVVRAKLFQMYVHLAPHPPYSSKIAPLDFSYSDI
jgi:hypothetical protein